MQPGGTPGCISGWQELQADLFRLTRESTHLIAGQSGHEIHREEPALVIDAICRMVERVRTGRLVL